MVEQSKVIGTIAPVTIRQWGVQGVFTNPLTGEDIDIGDDSLWDQGHNVIFDPTPIPGSNVTGTIWAVTARVIGTTETLPEGEDT